MYIKRGDNVKVITGRERSKQGKVLEVKVALGRVVVEGLNMRRRHVKPKKAGQKGQIITQPMPIEVSNIMLICPNCGKATRAARKIMADKTKVRICKKCNENIE